MVRLGTISSKDESTYNSEMEAKFIELICEGHREAFQQLVLGTVHRMEDSLYKMRVELKEEVQQLKYLLDQRSLPEILRDSIIARINELENSSLGEAHIWKAVVLDGGNHIISFAPPLPESTLSERVFILGYVESNNFWAVQASMKSQADSNQPVAFAERPTTILDYPTVFDENGLSHFQNCPVPPPLTAKMHCCTQDRILKLLTKGCLVSFPQHTMSPRPYEGGSDWKDSKKRWMNVSELYRGLPLDYPRNLTSCFGDCTNSLSNIQNSQREPCQSYSDFIVKSFQATMRKHSPRFFIYWFLSRFGNVRNRNSWIGEAN